MITVHIIKEGPLKDTLEIAEDLFVEISEDGSIAGLGARERTEEQYINDAGDLRSLDKVQ